MSYCTSCGTAQEPDARFCSACGTCVAEAQPQQQHFPAQVIKLHFQREKQRFIVGVTGVEVLIDNVVVANLPKEGHAVVEVQAGWRSITVRNAGQIPLLLGPRQWNMLCTQDSMISISIDRLTGCEFITKVWSIS